MALPKLRPQVFRPLLLAALALALLWTLFNALLSLSPCLVSSDKRCYRGYQSEYSFDVDQVRHASWMGSIPDDVNLTSLSIPGTHDTLTYDIDDEVFQCQNNNLSVQLEAGVRYLDVRGRLVDDEIRIYHADVYTGHNFADVLLTVFAFLEENPSEAIIMRLKEEKRPLGDNSKTFEDAYNWYLRESEETSPGAGDHFYQPGDGKTFVPPPSLGALRGKIYLLQEFAADKGGPYGLVWESKAMVLEDLWIIPSVDHLYMKWEAIEAALVRAAEAPGHDDALYLAHLSASVGVLPIAAAAGPVNGTVVGMNDRTGRWLGEQTRLPARMEEQQHQRHEDEDEDEDADVDAAGARYGKTGVVIMDFPGQELVNTVLERNSDLAAEGWTFL